MLAERVTAAQGERHPTEIAQLAGARLVVCSEIENGRKWAAQRIKELTGEIEVTARRMRQDPVTFPLTAKIIVMANNKPKVIDQGEAFWRRLRLVPFPVTIPATERDRHLGEKLEAELPGILNWALEGLRAWRSEGLGQAPEVEEAVETYRRQSDHISAFVCECCATAPRLKVRPGDLYEAYLAWAEKVGIEPANSRQFPTRLIELGYERYQPGGYAYWKGIALSGSERDCDPM